MKWNAVSVHKQGRGDILGVVREGGAAISASIVVIGVEDVLYIEVHPMSDQK